MLGSKPDGYGAKGRMGSAADPRGGVGGTGAGGARGMGSFGGLPGTMTRDQMMTQDQTAANVAKAINDKNGVGDSTWDKIGNGIAGMFGFNEMDPTVPGFSKPGMPGVTGRANWGFDPVGAITGGAGLAMGIPGLGLIGDQISSAMGRPLEMNMGADVFGADAPSAPAGLSDFETAASNGPATDPGRIGGAGNGGANGMSPSILAYLTGRTSNNSPAPAAQQQTPTTTPGTDTPAALDPPVDESGTPSFADPAPSVAAARSPFNKRLGGLSAGGFALSSAKKATKPASLAEGLNRYRNPYELATATR